MLRPSDGLGVVNGNNYIERGMQLWKLWMDEAECARRTYHRNGVNEIEDDHIVCRGGAGFGLLMVVRGSLGWIAKRTELEHL